MKDSQLKMGVRGLVMGPGNSLRCMDIRWGYWDKDLAFSEDFGAWDCTFVIMFVHCFSALFVEARCRTPKKKSPSLLLVNYKFQFAARISYPPILMDCTTKLRLCDLMG